VQLLSLLFALMAMAMELRWLVAGGVSLIVIVA
jgi:hypothetical protein